MSRAQRGEWRVGQDAMTTNRPDREGGTRDESQERSARGTHGYGGSVDGECVGRSNRGATVRGRQDQGGGQAAEVPGRRASQGGEGPELRLRQVRHRLR